MSRFHEIYQKERWGKGRGSGEGSDPTYCDPLRQFLEKTIREEGFRSVLDIGCGDWQFGASVDWSPAVYLGVDVVGDVIRWELQSSAVRFRVADATQPDTLAELVANSGCDLILAKDVMQHWSDDEVDDFLRALDGLSSWSTLMCVNDWRFVRDKSKNDQPRSVENPYSWAAIDLEARYGHRPVLHYPRNRRKRVTRLDRGDRT